MARPRTRRTTHLLTAAVALMLAAPTAHARRDAYGKYVKAARLLGQWRYAEARVAIAELTRRWPKAPETRYLEAEMSFLDGAYRTSLARIKGMDKGAVGGNVGALRSLVGSTFSVTKGFAKRESSGGHFVIYYPPGKDEVIVDLAGDVLEKAYQVLATDFGYKPPRKVRVEILPRPADLAKVSTLTEREIETSGTIALCKYNKLMVVTPRATLFGYSWMDTMVHEYVHYVVSRMSHDRVPVWLHEGLARFQQSRWRTAASGTLTAMDEHLLATAMAKRTLISFDKMHPSMAKLPSQEAAALAFAEVYTLVAYVHKSVGYDGLRTIIATTRGGRSARRAVGEALGKRWSRVERDWKAYLRASNLKPRRQLASRAKTPRIRFRKGGKGDTNVGLEEVKNAQGRKFTKLGGILRARGMPAAAAIEYEKALKLVGPSDPYVAAKLSRTYLELRRYARAIAVAKPLLAADETDAAPATTLGLAYAATGKSVEALTAFEVALRVSPFDPAVRCGLAAVYAALGHAKLAAREKAACTLLRRP